MKRLLKLSLLLMAMTCCLQAFANNVQISGLTRTGNFLSFNLSWDNSWRTTTTAPYNYDAVWIFVKYRDCATMQWAHANIDSANAASPLFADTTADQKGVMVYRSANGTGNITNVQVNVRLTGLPAGNFDFTVFGIEMVNVPTASYYLGDGSATYTWREGPNVATPFVINGEGAINVANTVPNLYAASNIVGGTIPAAFPKGYDAFFCMKYEISQNQYADFLNTLTSTQAAARYNISVANRYTLTGAWPTITATAGNRACNWLNWDDILSFLDWAALRPMTEFEYEKACRGTATYVPDEFAWGSSLVIDANTPVNDGTATETTSDVIPAGYGIANFANTSILGPLRNGYRGTGSTNRLQLGASYYGICEMSGNVWEWNVAAGSAAGRLFVPTYGNGALTPTGIYDVSGWVAIAGAGLRGGGWSAVQADCRTSDRSLAIYTTNTRGNAIGGRGVRK